MFTLQISKYFVFLSLWIQTLVVCPIDVVLWLFFKDILNHIHSWIYMFQQFKKQKSQSSHSFRAKILNLQLKFLAFLSHWKTLLISRSRFKKRMEQPNTGKVVLMPAVLLVKRVACSSERFWHASHLWFGGSLSNVSLNMKIWHFKSNRTTQEDLQTQSVSRSCFSLKSLEKN